MARITGVSKGNASFPDHGAPISKALSKIRDHVKSVVSGVVLSTTSRKFSASKGPIGNPKKANTAAKRSMPKSKGY